MAVIPNLKSNSPGARIASASERRQSSRSDGEATIEGSMTSRFARLIFPETMLDTNLATPL
jgi:hypothetical protein